MIAKQSKGRGFRGTLNYVLGKESAQVIGGNMLGENPKELAAEFSQSRKLKPNITRAVYHVSLALPVGEKLSNEQWAKISDQYLEKMGFQNSQYIVARHGDTQHDHIHIIASRIGLDGKCVSESNDYKRSESVVRSLEVEHGLTRIASSHEVEKRAPTRGEIEMASQGVVSTKLQLQGLIDSAISDHPHMSKFFERMQASGVQVIPNVAQTGHVSGVSFVLGSERMKGSDLGRGYTWAGLQKRGVSYEQERDGETISRSKKQAVARESGLHDREFTAERREASGSVDPRDGGTRHSDGHHDEGNRGIASGAQTHSGESPARIGGSPGPGKIGSMGDRKSIKQDDPETLGVDDDGRRNRKSNRSDLLRSVASALLKSRGRSREPKPAPTEGKSFEKITLGDFIENIFSPKQEEPQPEKEKELSLEKSKGKGRKRSSPDFFGF